MAYSNVWSIIYVGDLMVTPQYKYCFYSKKFLGSQEGIIDGKAENRWQNPASPSLEKFINPMGEKNPVVKKVPLDIQAGELYVLWGLLDVVNQLCCVSLPGY